MAIEYIGTDVADYAATYQTEADGDPVPFVSRWRVDAPSVPVAVYEDATGALLGSGISSATPEASGPHAGWYLASVAITSWSSAAGALLPTSATVVTFSPPTLAGSLSLPTSGVIATLIEPTYTSGSSFVLPTSAATATFVPPTFSGVLALAASGITATLVAPTIEEGGGGTTTLSDAFTGTNGAAPNASNWASVSDEFGYGFTAQIQSNKLRLTATGGYDEGDLVGGGSVVSVALSRGSATRTLVVTPSAASAGVFWRLGVLKDANNYFLLQMISATSASVFRMNAGSFTQSGIVTVPSYGTMQIVYNSNGDLVASVGGTEVGFLTGTSWGEAYTARLSAYVLGDVPATIDYDDFSVA